MYIILLGAFYFIRCDNWDEYIREHICVHDSKESEIYRIYRLENFIFAVKQIANNSKLLFYVILYIISIATFNVSGVSVTKYVSSVARAVVDTIRTIIVWTYFLVIPWVPEKTREKFSYVQLVGFAVLVVGTLIFNEIFVLPFCGFNLYTKEVLKRKERERENLKINEEEDREEEENRRKKTESKEKEDNGETLDGD